MAYPQATRQRIFNEALAFGQNLGRDVGYQAVYDWLRAQHQNANLTERAQLGTIADRAVTSLELAARMRDNPDTRPAAKSYPENPGTSARDSGYEFRVVVRTLDPSGNELARGLFVVNSDRRLTGAEVSALAVEMASNQQRGDPYYSRFAGRSGASTRVDVVAAFTW